MITRRAAFYRRFSALHSFLSALHSFHGGDKPIVLGSPPKKIVFMDNITS
jgi:hypothetical protein